MEIAESNELLTNVTSNYYAYNPPDVSVTSRWIAYLFVCNNESKGTYITVVGLPSFYNSALSNDVALLKPRGATREKRVSYGRIVMESNAYPIPLSPGESPKIVPLLITHHYENNTFQSKEQINISVDSNASIVEVIHPVNKQIIENINSLENVTIHYVFGETNAKIYYENGYDPRIPVQYTTNYDIYENLKRNLLSVYGDGALTI
ncbi:MAG: hypothetical protein AB3K77_13735 [Methanosarcinaceae archaeon]